MSQQTFRLGYGLDGMTGLTLDIYPLDRATTTPAAASLALTAVHVDRPLEYVHTRVGTLSGWYVCYLRDGGNLVVDNPWLVKLVDEDGTYDLAYFASIAPLIPSLIDGVQLAPDALDNIEPEPGSGVNLRQLYALIGAALLGKLSGVDTNHPIFKGINNNTTRIDATTDDTGRVTITLTPPS